MTTSTTDEAPSSSLPSDDLTRTLVVADPRDPAARRIFLAGDVYTILVSGQDTAGRYCLIDMVVPDGGGPGPHRHDFEEFFTLLEGELEFTFRGQARTVAAPASVAIPANAPHAFRNRSGRDAHMICMCAPAGQDKFFAAVGVPLEGPGAVPPHLNDADLAERQALMRSLAATYRTELLD